MSDRDTIFANIRKALDPLPVAKRTPLPDWDASLPLSKSVPNGVDVWEQFKRRWELVHGVTLDSLAQIPIYLKDKQATRGYIDPVLWDNLVRKGDWRGIEVETDLDRSRIDDYAFGITLAAGCIAESGTIILNDSSTSRRLAALAPWIHIALVPSDAVYPDVPTAISKLGNDHNVIWVTGPSKTADVEGILIEGVHGPGVQGAALLEG